MTAGYPTLLRVAKKVLVVTAVLATASTLTVFSSAKAAAEPEQNAAVATYTVKSAGARWTTWRNDVAGKSYRARTEAMNSSLTYLNYSKLTSIFGSSYVEERRQFAAGFNFAGGHLREISAAETSKVTAYVRKLRGEGPNPDVTTQAYCNGRNGKGESSGSSALYDKSGNPVYPYVLKSQYMDSCAYTKWIQAKDLTASTACGILAAVIPVPVNILVTAVCAGAVVLAHNQMESCRARSTDGSVVLRTKTWTDKAGYKYFQSSCSPQHTKALP